MTTIGKYPPFFAILFAPLVPLPYLLGAAVWFLIRLTILYFASQAIARMGWSLFKAKGTAPPLAWWVVPLMMSIVILLSNFGGSQINIFVFSLVALGLSKFINRKEHLAGLLIGAATAIKLTPGLFILYFAYKGNWKTVFWAALGGLLCWGVVLPVIIGPEFYMEVMTSWVAMLKLYAAEGANVDGPMIYRHPNQSLEAMFFRFFTHSYADGGFDNFYVNLINIPLATVDLIVKVLKVSLIVWLAFICRTSTANRNRPELMLEFSLIYIATLYISPISWNSHYVVMILAYATALYTLACTDKSHHFREKLLMALVVAVFLGNLTHPIFMAFSIPFIGSLVLFVTLARILQKQQGEPRKVFANDRLIR
jgi:alpha-1,2-mannosyltransferase